MDPDDRAYVVGLAEEVFGPAARAHRWPFLVDDDGAPLKADAFWPEHGVALALVAEPVERWRFAAVVLGLRDLRLLVVPAAALPVGDDGRVVREDAAVRRALFRAGLPGSREEFSALTDGSSVLWTTSTVDLEGAYRRGYGSWIGVSEIEDDDEADREVWGGSGGAEEPWLPGWTFDRFEENPWGGGGGWDEDRQAAIAARAARGEAAARGDDEGDAGDAGEGDAGKDDAGKGTRATVTATRGTRTRTTRTSGPGTTSRTTTATGTTRRTGGATGADRATTAGTPARRRSSSGGAPGRSRSPRSVRWSSPAGCSRRTGPASCRRPPCRSSRPSRSRTTASRCGTSPTRAGSRCAWRCGRRPCAGSSRTSSSEASRSGPTIPTTPSS